MWCIICIIFIAIRLNMHGANRHMNSFVQPSTAILHKVFPEKLAPHQGDGQGFNAVHGIIATLI